MAGIWDRINWTAPDRLPMHFLSAAWVLYSTGVFTQAQTRAMLNSRVNVILNSQEASELVLIKNWITSPSDTADKLVRMKIVESLLIAAEQGQIGEAFFREQVGL